MLLQRYENIYKPVSFLDKKLNAVECRYSVTERELLAITDCYEQCYHLLYRRPIKFITDHKPLMSMNNLKKTSGPLGRLFYKLVGVDYELEYIEG